MSEQARNLDWTGAVGFVTIVVFFLDAYAKN